MKKISTTALAKKRELDSSDLFTTLKKKGYLFYNGKEKKWNLTKQGMVAGGEIKYNPKFGEYVVWPEDINLSQDVGRVETLSATDLGDRFNISNRRVNKIAAELGWIEKKSGGWVVTKSGKFNSAFQMEHQQSGRPYVVWGAPILKNKHFLESINIDSQVEVVDTITEKSKQQNEYRAKNIGKYRALDGHIVKSRGELIIDNYLYREGIVHAYERKLPIDDSVICDFYLPQGKVYIEYWGVNGEEYEQNKERKLAAYAKNNYKLIELDNNDIENIDDTLPPKLRKYDINID